MKGMYLSLVVKGLIDMCFVFIALTTLLSFVRAFEPGRRVLVCAYVIASLAFMSFMIGQVFRSFMPTRHMTFLFPKKEIVNFIYVQWDMFNYVYNSFNLILQYLFGLCTLAIIDFFGTLARNQRPQLTSTPTTRTTQPNLTSQTTLQELSSHSTS